MNPRASYTADDVQHQMGRLRGIYLALPFEEFLYVAACDILDAKEHVEVAEAMKTARGRECSQCGRYSDGLFYVGDTLICAACQDMEENHDPRIEGEKDREIQVSGPCGGSPRGGGAGGEKVVGTDGVPA